MRNIRASTVVIQNNKVLLIHRIKNGKEYYVFPGGGIGGNETIKEAALRELKEETSITAETKKLIYTWEPEEKNHKQYYYLCNYISGTPQLDKKSVESQKMEKDKDNFYQPCWISLEELKNLTVFPQELKKIIIAS